MENSNSNSNQVAHAIMPELQNMVDGFKNLSSILAWVEGAREKISDLQWENEQLKDKLKEEGQRVHLEDLEELIKSAIYNQIEWDSIADDIANDSNIRVDHYQKNIELEVEIDEDDVEDAVKPVLIKAIMEEAKEKGFESKGINLGNNLPEHIVEKIKQD